MPDATSYPSVSIEEIPGGVRTLSGVATSITAFVGRALRGPVNAPILIESYADFEQHFGGLGADYPLSYAVRDFYLNGGSQAVIVRLSQRTRKGGHGARLDAATYTGSEMEQTGIFALEKADLFNLLCIPPDNRDAPDDATSRQVYRHALAYCARRRAMLLIDPPAAWSADPNAAAALAREGLPALGLSGIEARHAALYFPRLLQADPLRGNRISAFAPCGVVAGVMARTDAGRGVWKAPAGLDAALLGVQGLEIDLSDAQSGMLSALGINCLRSFPHRGSVVWGARTLRGADRFGDEYKYLPVRRLALFLEESLHRGTKWVVFEPNDESLWAQIRLSVGAFLEDLFRQGAFQGRTAREGYFVKCDGETTTQNDRDQGIVNIIVGFAPLKPAEFLVLRLQHLARQIDV